MSRMHHLLQQLTSYRHSVVRLESLLDKMIALKEAFTHGAPTAAEQVNRLCNDLASARRAAAANARVVATTDALIEVLER